MKVLVTLNSCYSRSEGRDVQPSWHRYCDSTVVRIHPNGRPVHSKFTCAFRHGSIEISYQNVISIISYYAASIPPHKCFLQNHICRNICNASQCEGVVGKDIKSSNSWWTHFSHKCWNYPCAYKNSIIITITAYP